MNNLAPINNRIPQQYKADKNCYCKINFPKPGAAKNILQQWLKDHPEHTRKEHLTAKENFIWLESRLSLRDKKCLG